MKKWIAAVLVIVVLGALAGCGKKPAANPEPKAPAAQEPAPVKERTTAEKAMDTFFEILDRYPEYITYHEDLSHWGITLPIKDAFEWVKDTSLHQADMALVLKADDFVEAGLDVTKLEGWLFKEANPEMGAPDRLVKPFDLTDASNAPEGRDNAKDSFTRIIEAHPNQITFATDLYHFNMGEQIFSWGVSQAGEMKVVFTVEAAPFVAAGLDTAKLAEKGWTTESGKLVKTVVLN